MQVDQVLRMKAGTGNGSYAQNSVTQRGSMAKTELLLEECIREICSSTSLNLSDKSGCMMVADLGCASGPNALSIIPSIINILTTSTTSGAAGPNELAVFLNDLPQNDFNSIFQMLPADLHDDLLNIRKIPCFISATPGSFYTRLFPTNFLHFVRSNSGLHWLSQVPEGLIGENGEGLNIGCLTLQKKTPPKVRELYKQQFNRDFTSFLTHRSKEVLAGGRMLLTFSGRPNLMPDTGILDLASEALNQMASEGVINQPQLDKFNLPFYTATLDEIKEAIEVEGSFTIHKLETFSLSWDDLLKTSDDVGPELHISKMVKLIGNSHRAVMEPLFAAEFGDDMMDILFKKLEGVVENYLMTGETLEGIFRVVVSLVRNDCD